MKKKECYIFKGGDNMHAGILLRKFRINRGWSQIKMASSFGIKNSTLSQLENGHILLTNKFIYKMEDSNVFEKDELQLLRDQAAVDTSKRNFGVDVTPKINQPEANHMGFDDGSSEIKEFDVKSLPEFLDNIERDLEKNEQVINGGKPHYVSRWLEKDTLPILWSKVDQTMHHAPSEAWPIQKCLSKALVQYGLSHAFWMPCKEAASLLRKCATDLEFLAQTSNQKLPRIQAYYCNSYADYHENKNSSSLGKASLGLMLAENSKIKDKKIFQNFYELIAFASAKLGNKDQARKSVDDLRDLINSSGISSQEHRGSLNTIARVESAQGLKEFWKIHDKNKSEIEGNRKGFGEPFNMLINIWAELEAMRKLKTLDKGQLESLIEKTKLFSDDQFLRIKMNIWGEIEKVRRLMNKKH
jgi:transcriptional regulator with XRE-family HTH domain